VVSHVCIVIHTIHSHATSSHLLYTPLHCTEFWFKGTVSRDFLFLIFFMNQFPASPRVYSQFKVHHRYQRHRRQIFPPVSLALLISDIGGNRCQRYRRQICHQCQGRRWQFATCFNDNGGKFATGVVYTSDKQWEQLSNCWQLKMNLKKRKIIYMLTLLPKGVQKEIIKILLIENVFHLPPVSLTSVANVELRISPRIFEKIRNGPKGIIREGLGGNWFMKKNQKQKSRDTVPLN
jgi:hypothetical protein